MNEAVSIGALALDLVDKVAGDAFCGVAKTPSFIPDFHSRYFHRYIEEPMSGCWLWIGATGADGYGNFTLKQKVYSAHRTSYESANGDGSSVGFVVRHRCDLRCCVNPDHLVRGLPIDNVADAWRRGRMRPAIGENSGKSVLTSDLVKEIRRMAGEGTSFGTIIKATGVAKNTAWGAITGRTWKHLDGIVSADRIVYDDPEYHPYFGESHYKSRLTSQEVSRIKTRLSRGERGVDLASEYGVAKTTISAIKTGRNRRNG
jgi:hypothetical protein